jgi:hypothetical protein
MILQLVAELRYSVVAGAVARCVGGSLFCYFPPPPPGEGRGGRCQCAPLFAAGGGNFYHELNYVLELFSFTSCIS